MHTHMHTQCTSQGSSLVLGSKKYPDVLYKKKLYSPFLVVKDNVQNIQGAGFLLTLASVSKTTEFDGRTV